MKNKMTIGSSDAPTNQEYGEKAQGGNGEFGRLQSAVAHFLATKPDAGVVSLLVMSVVSLPVWVYFICWLWSAFRRGACAAITLVAICFLAMEGNAASDGVTYTREFLRSEQQETQKLMIEVERHCVNAGRLLDTDLMLEFEDEMVRANFLLDAAEFRLNGHPARIERLKGAPFLYVKSEEQKKLMVSYTKSIEQSRRLQLQLSELQKAAIEKGVECRLLKIYLSRREHFQQRIASGLKDSDVVLLELRQFIAANRDHQMADGAMQIAELQNTTEALFNEIKLLRAQVATNKPLVITSIVEREKIVEKPVPTLPAPAPERPVPDCSRELDAKLEAAKTETNRQSLLAPVEEKQNSLVLVSAPSSASVSTSAENTITTIPLPVVEMPSNGIPVTSARQVVDGILTGKSSGVHIAELPNKQPLFNWIIVSVALTLILLFFVRWLQRPFTAIIGRISVDGRTELTTLRVQPSKDLIILDVEPRVELADSVTDFPAALTVGRFGRLRIRRGIAQVNVGNQAIGNSPVPLRIGDIIQIDFDVGIGGAGKVVYVIREIWRSADAEDSLEINETAESRS